MPAGSISSRVLTLLFTDIAGSVSLKSEKGDRTAGELISLHREHVKRLAQSNSGRIIDWAGDGCFLTFETPSTAALFALNLQQIHGREADLPRVYIGIHMGEVIEHPGPEGEKGPPRVEGLAVDIAHRIESLALPGQILMSAAVFNSARQQLGSQDFDAPILWKNHGTYPLKGITDPIQIGEAGIEGLSPLKPPAVSREIQRAETIAEEHTPVLEPVDDNSLRGLKHIRRFTPDDFGKAVSALTKAVKSNQNNIWAHGALAYVYWEGSNQNWLQQLGVSYLEARLLAREHLHFSPKGGSSFAHLVESEIKLYRRQYDAAISEAEKAMALDPDNPLCSANMAHILIMANRCEEAIDICKQALQLDPPKPGPFYYRLGLAYFSMGQFEEAAEILKRAITQDPKIHLYAAPLAASCIYLGQDKRARAALEHYRKIRIVPPNLRDVMYFWPFKEQEISDRFAEGLRKAKLPGQRSGYYKVSEMYRLTGKEIKGLLFGKTVTGFYPWTGQQEWIDRDWAGKAIIRGGRDGETTLDRGESIIEGKILIDQWQERWKGLKIGCPVYRNPAGSIETKDEYLLFTDFGFWPISPISD